MQYENIPTVQLLIIAEILGLIAAELLPGRAAAFKRVWRHRKRSTTRQLLDIAPNCSVPRPAAAQLMLERNPNSHERAGFLTCPQNAKRTNDNVVEI